MFTCKTNKYNDVLRFIELYRSHEVLWNMNVASYRRNDLKVKSYNSIAAETKMSVEDVKKKIKSLRTAYSAEKSKVEKSKKSGCAAESVYIPSVFWFNEMNFLDTSLIRRKTIDNSNHEDVFASSETSLDSEAIDDSFLQLPLTETQLPLTQISATPSSAKKRKQPPESKLDEAIDKLIAINQENSVFDTFAEGVGKQIKEFPEDDAYEVMAEIQTVLSKRKVAILRRKSLIIPSRTSTSPSESSTSMSSSNILYCAMSDADIIEEE